MQYPMLFTAIRAACAPIYQIRRFVNCFHRRVLCCLGAAFAALFSCGATAADITPYIRDGVTQVIFIAGTITPGDRQKFANIALSTDRAVVVLLSDGGNLREALEIGKAIRMKGFPTYVAPNDVCASACALIWLAGSPRNMSSSARIGFHAVYVNASGVPEISSSGNAVVGSYLNSLGLPEAAVLKLTSAAPNDMQWLTPTEAVQFGIDVTVRDIGTVAAPQAAAGTSAVAKAPQATPISQLEAQASDFVRRYVSFENEEPNKSLELVSTAYALQVLHFGKLKTRQEVLTDYASFIERWPSRKYNLKPGSLKVNCSADQSQCVADAVLDWETSSADRNAKSRGVTSWHLVLSRDGGAFAIAAIDGKVLDRHLSKLNLDRGFCLGPLCLRAGANESGAN